MTTNRPIGRSWPARRLMLAAALLLAALLAALLFLRHLEHGPTVFDLAQGRVAKDASVVFVSGDAGLRTWSIGGRVAGALAKSGYAVTGIDSLAEFSRRRTADDAAAIVRRAMDWAEARNPGRPVILIGQSFGSDILVVAVDRLPAEVRRKIGEIILIVPGTHAYLRVSPGEVMGIDPPDVELAPLAARMADIPITCIHGAEEQDSLCPLLSSPDVKVVALPGGHMLNHDSAAVLAAVQRAIAAPPGDGRLTQAKNGTNGGPDASL